MMPSAASGLLIEHQPRGEHKKALGIEDHFEKMLYDTALLSRVFLHAHQASGDPFLRSIVEETLDYALREMTSPEGGFYSTQDADSEGEDGKFFVWTPDEVDGLSQRIPLLAGRTQIDGSATAYVCENYACQLPVDAPASRHSSASIP